MAAQQAQAEPLRQPKAGLVRRRPGAFVEETFASLMDFSPTFVDTAASALSSRRPD
jgi:hypothetical protein